MRSGTRSYSETRREEYEIWQKYETKPPLLKNGGFVFLCNMCNFNIWRDINVTQPFSGGFGGRDINGVLSFKVNFCANRLKNDDEKIYYIHKLKPEKLCNPPKLMTKNIHRLFIP